MRKPSLTPAAIFALRSALNLTQESFAHEVGVSVSQVSRWEAGTAKPSPLAVRVLERLRDGLPEAARV